MGLARQAMWPSPRAANVREDEEAPWAARKAARGSRGAGTPLGIAVKTWQTPQSAKAANDTALMVSGDGRAQPNLLGWAVSASAWPTPVARDHKGPGMEGQLGNLGRLNPEWVETLMGFPEGWTDVPYMPGRPARASRNTDGSLRARPRRASPTAPPA